MAKARDYTANWHFGDSFDDIVVDVTQPDGTSLPLEGYSARMDIKVAPDSVSSSLSLTNAANDGITIDSVAGRVVVDATYTKMLSGTLAVDVKYYYQLQIQSATKRRTLVKGRFISLEDIAEN